MQPHHTRRAVHRNKTTLTHGCSSTMEHITQGPWVVKRECNIRWPFLADVEADRDRVDEATEVVAEVVMVAVAKSAVEMWHVLGGLWVMRRPNLHPCQYVVSSPPMPGMPLVLFS